MCEGGGKRKGCQHLRKRALDSCSALCGGGCQFECVHAYTCACVRSYRQRKHISNILFCYKVAKTNSHTKSEGDTFSRFSTNGFVGLCLSNTGYHTEISETPWKIKNLKT